MEQTLERPWTEHPDLVAFYADQRKRPEDLYLSERRFLPWLAGSTTIVLDVGCAAAGFKRIWSYYQSDIIYMGVDVSASLIATARKKYPDSEFYQANCTSGLPLLARCASTVQALGWLHWEPKYREAINELWRITERYLFFDVRLSPAPDMDLSGSQKIAFTQPWDGITTTPYLVLSWLSFADVLASLKPTMILGYGYLGKPAGTVIGIEQQICFATFVLEKSSRSEDISPPTICLDMPMAWPTQSEDKVNLLPAVELDKITQVS